MQVDLNLPHCLTRRMIVRRVVIGAVAGTALGVGIAFGLDILLSRPVAFFFSGHGTSSVAPIVTELVLIVGGICGCTVGALAICMSIFVESNHHHAMVTNTCADRRRQG